ncbi:hypothetical protein JST97_09350 [bacterium]|nr:hypothetical protein [bacterium]
MKIQLPAPVQNAFDRFRKTGSLGEGAEKHGPEMELMQFISLRDNLEEVQRISGLDNKPGMDDDPAEGSLKLTAAALQGKPYQSLEACGDGPETVLIHKTGGDKQSFEMATVFNGAPAYLNAIHDNGQWMIGSNMLVMVDGQPQTDDFGIPKCTGEFLVAR